MVSVLLIGEQNRENLKYDYVQRRDIKEKPARLANKFLLKFRLRVVGMQAEGNEEARRRSIRSQVQGQLDGGDGAGRQSSAGPSWTSECGLKRSHARA